MGVDEHAEAISRISDSLGWKRDERGRLKAIIDRAAEAKTLNGRRSVTELFYECGILADPRVNKDVFAGIAEVKRYLRRGNGMSDLYIFSSCPNLIREFKGYFWGSGERPVKENDHGLDAIRYYLMRGVQNARPSGGRSAIERDKSRRIRRLRRRGF